jgi:Protein of unknown function (DUF2510)
MADVEAGQGTDTRVVSTWRAPLETAALIVLAALVVAVVGAIVGAVFRPGADAWVKLSAVGINVVSPWHVALLVIAVGLVFALRLPFPPDARGASTARLVLLGAAVLSAVVALCAFIGIIGTIGLDLFGVTVPLKIGQIMELLGGGAVAVAAGLLALRGQRLVPAPVRAPAPPSAAPTAAAPGGPGWGADPFGRHQWRYWDGNRWTDQVADGSTQSTDPAN